MRVHVFDNDAALSRHAANTIRDAAQQRPDMLLCAASGATPTATYDLLADMPDAFARLRVVKLDEWVGLAMEDPATCESYLRRHLLEPLAIPPERYLSFCSDAEDPQAECRAMQARLDAEGPIDVCLLGLGRNGHVAMNEPAAALEADCHVAALSRSTRRHPMLADARAPVSHGLTLGMATILRARKILLLVSGRGKRAPLKRLLTRRITPRCPASFLWSHLDAECLCDAETAKGLERSIETATDGDV